MKWISAKTPPTHENEVLIHRCNQRGFSTERVDVGYYNQVLKCWRPRGCNGNWSDEVLHWMEKPLPPEEYGLMEKPLPPEEYELIGAITTEGFASTEFNLALPVEGPALSKSMMYDIILIPKKQF